MKIFYSVRDPVKRIKKQVTNLEKMCANYIPDKRLISKI